MHLSFKYLFPTEFVVRTISYGLSFSPFDLWPKRKACGPYIVGEKQGSVTVTVRTKKTRLVKYFSNICFKNIKFLRGYYQLIAL